MALLRQRRRRAAIDSHRPVRAPTERTPGSMKLFLDFLPIILFFGVFKIADLHAADAARYATEHLGFVVSGGIVGSMKRRCCSPPSSSSSRLCSKSGALLSRRKVDSMLWVDVLLIAVLGGMTVWFHNPTFIKWKPSVLDWAMAVVLWLSQACSRRTCCRPVGAQLDCPSRCGSA